MLNETFFENVLLSVKLWEEQRGHFRNAILSVKLVKTHLKYYFFPEPWS